MFFNAPLKTFIPGMKMFQISEEEVDKHGVGSGIYTSLST
jgi:hypothetical protein